jgi:hypothetical protein
MMNLWLPIKIDMAAGNQAFYVVVSSMVIVVDRWAAVARHSFIE